jgi:Ycf66 protein N-terminus.
LINIGFSPNIVLGFILGLGVMLLYLLRIVKPEVARDEDIFLQQLDCCIVVF